MTTLRTMISILILSTAFFACKKDSNPATPPPAALQGTYSGKYGFGNESPDNNYTLTFAASGAIQEIGQASGAPTGQGTWALNGNKLTAEYTMLFAPFNDYFIVATVDAAAKTITGTWGFEAGGTDGGKFTLVKK